MRWLSFPLPANEMVGTFRMHQRRDVMLAAGGGANTSFTSTRAGEGPPGRDVSDLSLTWKCQVSPWEERSKGGGIAHSTPLTRLF